MSTDDLARLVQELQTVADNRDLGGFGGTITTALAQRVLHELADSPRFWPSVNQLIATVDPEHHEALVMALGELGRLGVTLKARGEPVRGMATTLLGDRLPAHFSFGDGDQRYYAAVVCRLADAPIDNTVLARTVVLEDTSDKARRAWLSLLLDSPVSDVLRALTLAIRELNWLRLPGASRSFDSSKDRCRRVTALLKALRAELDPDKVTVDDEVIAALSDLVAAAFAYVPPSDRYQESVKAVDAYISLVLHLIRIKFRLLTEPELYATVSRTKRWLPDGGWRRITSTGPMLRTLRSTLAEGLVLLLKQGKVSVELAEVHRALSPNPQEATRELAAIARAEQDLSAEMRAWLETGESIAGTEEEAGLSGTDDTAVAMALLAAHELGDDLNALTLPSGTDSQTAQALESVQAVEKLVARTEELRSRVLSLAQRRSLSVFGEVDTVVEFSPHAHRAVGDRTGASKVTVVKRGVEAATRRGSRVIIRAIVS